MRAAGVHRLLRRLCRPSHLSLDLRLVRPLPSSPTIPFHRLFHDSQAPLPFPPPPLPFPTELAFNTTGDAEDPYGVASDDAVADLDPQTHDFIARFAHAFRPMVAAAFPSADREVLDEMLLVICQHVLARLEPTSAAPAPDIELSDDLWKSIYDTSAAVQESMRREKLRSELKKYLHCEEVKKMYRFAVEIGIHGPLLRNLWFKWAKEKLEEVEFHSDLEKMMEEELRGKEAPLLLGLPVLKQLNALPTRDGRIRYNVCGMDLSDPKWVEVAQKAADSVQHFVPEETQPVEAKCRSIEERILGLDAERDDVGVLLLEWKEAMEWPRRADWLALLDRIKLQNPEVHLKALEHLLSEQSYEPSVGDYNKLIGIYTKTNSTERAEKILMRMTEAGITPDTVTSILLFHMYSIAVDIDKMKSAFDSLRREGFRPDLKMYNSMILAYAKAGRPKEGEMLIAEMEKQRGFKFSEEIFSELLRAFAKNGNIKEAQTIMRKMQIAGMKPAQETFTLLIEAEVCRDTGNHETARELYEQMKNSGYKPDDRCTASMVSSYMKSNLLDKAIDLLLDLEKEGFQRGIATNTVLADWFCRLLLVHEAEQVVRKIAQAGDLPVEIHVALCDMYCKVKQEEKARKSLEILEAKKNMLQADQYERVIAGLRAGELAEDAARFSSMMQEVCFAQSSTPFSDLVFGNSERSPQES